MTLKSILTSSFLSDTDIIYLNKYKVEEVKKEKAYSLIFKNQYVKDYKIDEYGKPYSPNCFFNVSHSNGVVIFVKDNLSIGIDMEQIRPVENDLVDYISSKEEKEYINNDINFFEIWTNKESLMKNIGIGLKDKIKEIPALPINGVKEFDNKKFYTKTIMYHDYVISITRESDEPFEVTIKEIKYE